MFKAGQLVRIKDVRKGALSVSYVPVYVIENNQRVVEHTSKGLASYRHKMKRLPLHSICLFLEYYGANVYLLHEEQIIEAHMDWIEPL
jgi:hypothetical protein